VSIVFEQAARRRHAPGDGRVKVAASTPASGPMAMPTTVLNAFRTLPGFSARNEPVTDLSMLSLMTKATLVVQLVMLLLRAVDCVLDRHLPEGLRIKRPSARRRNSSAILVVPSSPALHRRRIRGEERHARAHLRVRHERVLKLPAVATAGDARRRTRAMRASYQREMDGLESR